MTDNLQRLQKVIAAAGITSRRKAEGLISSGQVYVNGKQTTELGTKVRPLVDEISINGKTIIVQPKIYLMLNKPKGYVASSRSFPNQPSVLELIKNKERIFTVGRLDKDTTGLLLLTNDGNFDVIVSHPRYQIQKKYRVGLRGKVALDSLKDIQEPIYWEGEAYNPISIKLLNFDKKENLSFAEIIVAEGKNHEVKNIFEAFGFKVITLQRISLGKLNLGSLKIGQSRPLTNKEIGELISYGKKK